MISSGGDQTGPQGESADEELRGYGSAEARLGCDVRYSDYGGPGELLIRHRSLVLRPRSLGPLTKDVPTVSQDDVDQVEVTVARWNPLSGVTTFVSEGGWTAAATFSRTSLTSLEHALRVCGIDVEEKRSRFSGRRLDRLRRP